MSSDVTAFAITYLHRRSTFTGFSIEKLFDLLSSSVSGRGVEVNRLELPFVSSGIASVMRNAWFVRRNAKPSILHVTGDVHYAALLCPRSKIIITVHDCVVLKRGRGLKKLVLWLLWFKLPMRFASAITVISQETKDQLLSTVSVPAHKVHLIPNFVNPAYSFEEKIFNDQLPRILHVGTRPNKNLPRVIEAVSRIKCVLVIVGSIDVNTQTLLDRHNVAFENYVGLTDEQLLALYRSADIISFPSTYEGFGMPVIEGQSVGRPVLTSDMEPMRTVAGEDGARLVDPFSVESIRAGFEEIVGNGQLRDALVRNGVKNASQYSLEQIAARYHQLYETVNAQAA